MLKKLIVIPIMFLYLLAISGVMIHLHYCGTKLESWNVYAKTKGCKTDCDNENAPTHKCCKDKVITAKVSEDHSVSFISFKTAPAEFTLPQPVYYTVSNKAAYKENTRSLTYAANAPPGLWQGKALYKLHSSLVYYG